MRFDEHGVLVSEIWPDNEGYAANRGDSMANTSRYNHLLDIVESPRSPNMTPFVSDTGYLRHPSPLMPSDWRESDSSSDQCLPFYVAATYNLQAQMRERMKANGWKTGNGDLCAPVFMAILKNSWLVHPLLAGQALLLKIPIRYNDEKKRLTWEPDASADYLNWFHACVYTKSLALKLVSREAFMAAVRRYFKDEPNAEWLVLLYDAASLKVWK